ncbi:MAG: protein jag [Chloroflexi bacterium]|nr:protein jag [Chloroflexota bacterium]
MEILEVSDKTVDAAIAKALKQLGITREDVNIIILSEGKSGGLFGLGAEDARISVEVLTLPTTSSAVNPDVVSIAKGVLEKLLVLMEVEGIVVPGTYPDESGEPNTAPIAFNIEGEDLGILIGRRGQTLSSLQYMVRLVVGHQTNTWIPIVIDAEGYKQRRYDALKVLAQRMAEQVKTKGVPFTLEPMPAYERRIVHMALADNPAVYTESIGEGESRKVVIHPKRPSNFKGNSSGPRGDNSFRSKGGFSGTRGNSFNRQ